MRKILGSAFLFANLACNVQAADIFNLTTNTVVLPQLWVGSSVYNIGLQLNPNQTLSLTQVTPIPISITGSWYAAGQNSTASVSLPVVLTFLPDGVTYVFANNGNTTAIDPGGQPGIEVGTYTYNPITGAFSSQCPTINTDGEWGLSNNNQGSITGCYGSVGTVTVNGNTLTMSLTNGASMTFTRM